MICLLLQLATCKSYPSMATQVFWVHTHAVGRAKLAF